jgi:hypothetical protein
MSRWRVGPVWWLVAFSPLLIFLTVDLGMSVFRGSVLIVAVWHGLFDYVTACTECKSGLIAAVLSMVVMVWAVLILIVCRGTNLSRAEKQVL